MKTFIIQTDGKLYKVVDTKTSIEVKKGLSFIDAERLCEILNIHD